MSERTAAKEKTGNSAARHTVKAGLIPIPYFARFSMVLASARSEEKMLVTSGSSDLI
jgi:hypothetical protein